MRWLALFLLSACAPAHGAFACDGTLWTFDLEPSCALVKANIDTAELMFGRVAREVRVTVVGDEHLGDGAFGNYDARWGIVLECSGLSFGHELLHKIELDEGKVFTFAHAGWENGNFDLAQSYVNRASPLRCR